jgi:predicted nucleotidyltransferase
MHREFALDSLRSVFGSLSELLVMRIQIYAFGSILRKTNNISDVDIVIVYESEADLGNIKRVLESFGRMIPLDVLYMSFEEEIELNFLAQQRAINVFEDRLGIGCTRTTHSPLHYEFAACEP